MKKISRRSFLKASAVLGSAAALTACGGSSASTSTAPAASGSTAAAPSGDTIKIGTIYAMSGGNAAIGENILRGIDFASVPFGAPEIIAVSLTVAIHVWKRNNLLSIGVSTTVYMLLLRLF